MSPRSSTRDRIVASVRLLGLASVCLASRLAHADPAPLSATLTAGAKTAFDAGNLLYDTHDYAGAATKYRAAYEASHDARVLWNVASCEKELRHYARSAALVEQFIRDAAPLVAPDFIAQANLTLSALREFYSPVTLAVLPAGAHLLIDGEEMGQAPFVRPIPVDLGRHVVRAEHEGFAPLEQAIDVVGQSPIALQIALKPIANEATLEITPSESQDSVAVDDNVVGLGRWEGVLAAGRHQVKVTAEGKQAYIEEIELTPGERRSIDVTLERKKGAIWPWLAGGGALVLGGGAVGAYFLFKPGDTKGPPPVGTLGTVYVGSLRGGGRR